MRSIRQHRALIAWIALVALIGNLAVAMACSVPVKKQTSDYPVELLGALVICSEHGETTLPDDGGAPPPSKPCQLCSAALSFTLVLAVAVLFGLMPLPRSEPMRLGFVATFADRLFRAGLGSRAPPLPA